MGSAMIQEQLLCGLDAQQSFIAGFGFASQTILRADATDIAITFRQIGREILTLGDRIASRNVHKDLLIDVTQPNKTRRKQVSLDGITCLLLKTLRCSCTHFDKKEDAMESAASHASLAQRCI